MKVLRVLALLFLFIGVLKIAQEPVYADACQDTCLDQFNGCIMSSDMQYDTCYNQADQVLMTCQSDAESFLLWCYDVFCGNTHAGCMAACDGLYYDQLITCQNNFDASVSSCGSDASSREAACQATFDYCQAHC